MRSALLSLASIILTFVVVGNAYYQKKQFYPSVVYITKSNPSMAVIYLQAFVMVLLMGKLMRKVFFGQLRAAEMEHLIERSWYAVTETCLAFTVFRDDFSPKFVALFTLLLFLKCFHWLAEDRVDYMERSPVISWLFHIRVISLLSFLGSLDYLFVSHAYHSTLMKGPSVQLVFGFEYAILLSIVMNIFLKYVLHTIDLQSENPWENKAVYLLYSELIMGCIKVLLYVIFMTIMIKIHTFPLFAIRPMYLSMRAFKKAINDVIMSRRAIRNMNTLYPDATPEELATVDNVCIICREEMSGGGSSKKLPCNHIFHASCLRSWFQRQQTCPTCRMDVLRVANPPAAAAATNERAANAANPLGQQLPQQPQPPQANLNNWPGFLPGAFPPPFWFPQQQQQQQQQTHPQTQQSEQTSSGAHAPEPGTTAGASAASASATPNSTSPNGGGLNSSPYVMPPFPFMPFLFLPSPPPPPPSSEASRLSNEELQGMEGQERENILARIQCLRNIQTLLDAAVLQMQQYTAVVSSLRSSQPNVPNSSSSNPVFDPYDSIPTFNEVIPGSSAPTSDSNEKTPKQKVIPEPSSTNLTDVHENAETSAQAELRRRRLQKFAQDQEASTSSSSQSQKQTNSTSDEPQS